MSTVNENGSAACPIVKDWTLKGSAKYESLWMVYVDGVELSVHCQRSLLGPKSVKSKRFGSNERRGEADAPPIVLDEAVTPYYYICGLASPRNWENNLHIAFRYKPGSVIEVETERERWIIENAERIDILESYVDKNDPNYHDDQYRTCRNWQFAHYVASQK